MSLLSFLLPFARAFNGALWHDTFALVVPPLGDQYFPFKYFGAVKPAIIYYLYPGDAREYNPATGTVGERVRTIDAGFIHGHPGYMLNHIDPFVDSFIEERPYELLAWLAPEKPHELWIYNRTQKFIWFDITIWLIQFDREKVTIAGKEFTLEELLNDYLKGIAFTFLGVAKPELLPNKTK